VRESYQQDPESFESPTVVEDIWIRPNCGEHHKIKAIPPDACPRWMFRAVQDFFDWRSGLLGPEALARDNRTFEACRILSGAMASIDRARWERDKPDPEG